MAVALIGNCLQRCWRTYTTIDDDIQSYALTVNTVFESYKSIGTAPTLSRPVISQENLNSLAPLSEELRRERLDQIYLETRYILEPTDELTPPEVSLPTVLTKDGEEIEEAVYERALQEARISRDLTTGDTVYGDGQLDEPVLHFAAIYPNYAQPEHSRAILTLSRQFDIRRFGPIGPLSRLIATRAISLLCLSIIGLSSYAVLRNR